jgi:hypothetical protein
MQTGLMSRSQCNFHDPNARENPSIAFDKHCLFPD